MIIMAKLAKGTKAPETKIENPEDCVDCKFNLSADDEQVRCEFAKMLGKTEPGCENYEKK